MAHDHLQGRYYKNPILQMEEESSEGERDLSRVTELIHDRAENRILLS